jgi:PAS domain S-box-containing protein
VTKPRILVVEDEVIVAKDIQRTLERMGYPDVTVAHSGEEAVEMAKGASPSLVLMDIMLGGKIDGIEAAEEIATLLGIPVIYLTAYTDDETLGRAKLTEPFGYLVKPLVERELGITIEMALYKHKMDQRVRDSEAKYRTVFTLSPEAIVLVDTTGTVVDLNARSSDWIGYDPEEIIGQELSALPFLPEQSKAKHLEMLPRRLAGEEIPPYELEFRTKKGDRRIGRIVGTPLSDEEGRITGSLAMISDITERKCAEEATRQQAAQLEALRQVGLEITAEVQTDALLHSVVSRAVELLGGACGDLYMYQTDQDTLELMMDVGIHQNRVQRKLCRGEGLAGKVLQSGDPVIVSGRQRAEAPLHGKEEVAPAAMVGVPICWKGDFLGVLTVSAEPPRVFSQDDGKLLMLFSMQAAIALRNARLVLSLRELNAFKDAVIGMAAHDLRGPLTHILGYLHILADDMEPVDSERMRLLDGIERSVERMNELIEGILAYRKMTSEAKLELRSCDLNEIAERVVTDSQLDADKKSHQLVIETAPVPLMVQGDELLLREAVFNLVSNSIKFSSSGGTIAVRTSDTEDGYDLVVQDTGPGIADDDLEKLFQPFAKLKSAGQKRGIGLGLSLVKTIIERHGAQITVDSAVGVGTKFTIHFPRDGI